MSTSTLSKPGVTQDYRATIAGLHAGYGIPGDYAETRQLPLCEEAKELVSIGPDSLGRDQRMTPQAAAAWQRMQTDASKAGVQLLVVSAYRSVDYQCALIQRKLDRGLKIADILKINAAPGYSEHHTGRCVDITTPGFTPLEEEFEHSPAFAWLQRNAATYRFALSYPRGNRHGIAYEPWHWCWRARSPRH